MVNIVYLVLVLTLAWIFYGAVRIAPWMAKRWKAWGEVAALIVFTAVEVVLLVAFLKPS